MTGRVRSNEWFARAERVLPGGVDSPVRAFGSVGGTPLVIRSAQGTTVTDMDGRPLRYNRKESLLNPGFMVVGDAETSVGGEGALPDGGRPGAESG
jgi:glutamate-1-semialdehyde aminotransferase